MGFREFNGELDAPTKFVEFNGELDAANDNGIISDIGTAAHKGAIAFNQSLIGIGDLLTRGRVGKEIKDAGYDAEARQKYLDSQYSDETQAANKAVREADGFVDTVKAAAENPRAIGAAVIESLPQMVGGAGVAKGLINSSAKALSPVYAGAAGEGVMSAGSSAESIREASSDEILTGKQSLAAIAAGIGTGAFGALGGKISQKLGLADIDTILAQGGPNALLAGQAKQGFIKSVVGSGISEGVFEELPQSVQEQMWQNFALDKPVMEGVGNAAAMGLITGAAMGTVGGGYNAIATKPQAQPEDILQTATVDDAINKFTEATQAPVSDVASEYAASSSTSDNIPADELVAGLDDPILAQADGAASLRSEQPAPPFNPATAVPVEQTNAIPSDTQPVQQTDIGSAMPAGGVVRTGSAPGPSLATSANGADAMGGELAAGAQEQAGDAASADVRVPAGTGSAPITPVNQGEVNASQSNAPSIETTYQTPGQSPAIDAAGQSQAPVTPVFGTNSVGKITLRGVPMEKIQAVRDKLGAKGWIIGRDSAIFPRGADLKVLQQEFGVTPPAAAPKAKKPRSASTDLRGRIIQLGGINSKYASDVTGEQKPQGAWKFAFGKAGLGLDDLASQLAAEGFNINLSDPTDNGGVNQLSEMIRRHIGGERAFKAVTQETQAETMAKDEARVEMERHAATLGIKDAHKLSDRDLGDAVYMAEDAIIVEQRLRDEAEAEAIIAFSDAASIEDDIDFVPSTPTAIADWLGEEYEQRESERNVQQVVAKSEEGGTRTDSGSTRQETGAGQEILQSYTNAEVLKREAAKAKADEDAGKEAPAKNVTADQVDLFQTQGGLFNSNREQPAVKDSLTPQSEASGAKTGNVKQADFIQSPSGSIDFGEITPDMAQAMRRQSGKIRLERGDADYGLTHIEARHGKQIRNLGFDSIEAFVADAVSKVESIWSASKTSQMVMIQSHERGKAVFIQLKPAKTGDYYTVNTAFPVSDGYVENKKWEKLWGGESVPADASGAPSFAEPALKAGEQVAMTSSQSNSNVAQPSSESKRSAISAIKSSTLDAAAKLKAIEALNAGGLAPEDVQDVVGAPSNTEDSGQYSIDKHSSIFERTTEGTITADEFKAAFYALVAAKESVIAELEAMTKPQIFKRFPGLEYRYKSEKKDAAVAAAYRDMVSDFTLSEAYSYGMSSGSMLDSIRSMVEKTTDKSLAAFAEAIKQKRAEREAARAEALAGMENPATLEDFNRLMNAKAKEMGEGVTFQQVRMTLTQAQRTQFDELAAAKTRAERASRKVAQQEQSLRAPGESVETTEIIKTKHTKHGHDLWQFQMVRRVSPEEFKSLVTQAKRIGGDYSSYRGNGAIPGWQFRNEEAAKAFKALVAGDTEQAKGVMDARRDAYSDDRSQSAVERLTEMADALDEKADASLNQERKANTARRARFAASAEASANADKAMAQTMRNIATGIANGTAKMLDRVRQKVQVEALQGFVRTAFQEQFPKYADQEKNQPSIETADYAKYPSYTAYRSDLANLGRALLEVEGTMKLGQRLMKVADDVSDAYLKFAKENLHKVSRFSVKGGGALAAFKSKSEAEAAIARSGFNGKAIVLPFKRNENMIILSPSEAIKLGIWEGDNDKRISLSADFGEELVEKIGKAARRGAKVSVPWQFENTYNSRKRLAGMNIETPAELRAALREFIGLRETAKQPDKIKQMERAMIGRKNDGFDFFPTPAVAADDAIAAADIKEGMTVYEPQAGMGHIADRIREAGVEPDVGEIATDRRELLEAKGYNIVSQDFMDMRLEDTPNGEGYDRIIMNPPFSDRRDALHVQHAYDLLKPGGRLVSIMGEGVFFGQDKKAESFRDWLDSVGGTEEKLEQGTFMDPSLPVNTGVSARMVVIDKSDKGAAKFSRAQPQAKLYSNLARQIEAEGLPMFAKRNQSGRGLSVSAVESIANPIAEKLKNVRTVKVVARQTEIPGLKEQIDAAFSRFQEDRSPENLEKYLAVAKDDIEGAYVNGELYLVASNLSSPERVQEVLRHEVGHLSVEQMLNEVDPKLYGRLISSVTMLDRAGNKYIRELAAAVDKSQPGLDARTRSAEIIAQIAERGDHEKDMPSAVRTLWQRMADGIKAFYKLVFGDTLNDQDVRDIVAQSFRWARGEGDAVRVYGGTESSDVQASRGTQSPESFARMAIEELAAENDSLFSYKKSNSKSLTGVVSDVVDGSEYLGDMTREDERAESHADRRYGFKTHNGKLFYVYETDDDKVWIDVSRLEAGSGGGAVYAAVGNYAFNTGKKFIGDPFGLSPEAVIRRTHHMLSSAIRFGTTRHLEAAEQQEWGSPDDGVAPLEWRGTDIDKVEAMIHTIVETAENVAPSLTDFHYDFQKSKFSTAQGQPVTGEAMAVTTPRNAGIGEKTARRVALLRSLLDADRTSRAGGRSGILEKLLSYDNSSLPESMRRIFSRRVDGDVDTGNRSGGAKPPSQQPLSPSVEFSGTELGGKSQPITQLVMKARTFARRMFAEKTVTATDGHEILIPWSGIKHTFSGKVSANAAIVASKLDKVIENGVLIKSAPDKENRNTIKAVHTYETSATVAGEPVTIHVIVREALDGKRFYDHYEAGVEVAGGMSGERTGTDSTQPTPATLPNVPGKNNIPPSGGQVNLPLQGGQSGNPASWDSPEASKLDNIIYTLQDKHIDMKRVVEAIKEAGGNLLEKFNPYLAEELFHGRAAKRTQDFVNTELKPLLTDMRMRGITVEALDKYLHARHAKEANALIAERDPEMQDGGSGMTNSEVDEYMENLSDSEKKRLESVAVKVDFIITKTRDLYVSYGLISKDQADSWAQMFEHYVPLMREDHDGGMGIGQGFSIKGKEAKHRTGSTAKVVDILANIALQREKAITRGEKNRVAVALAGLVKMNPNPDFWTFGRPPTERVLNEKTGLVEERIDPTFKSKPNVVVAKIKDSNGQVHERAVVFNEQNERAVRMVEAFKNLDSTQLGGVLGVSAMVTRYFASINTQYNPVFGIVNITRDIQGMALNLSSTPLAEHRMKVVKLIPSMIKGIYQDARMERKGHANDSETSRLWEELQDEGGMTGYRDLYRNSADRANDIEHELNPTRWHDSALGKVFTANGTLKVPLSIAQKQAGWLFDWLSDYNQTLEGATRLAAYKVAIDNGMSKQEAASLAKNITVNFNRKGHIGQQAGALYAFFNAAMQGTARIAETMLVNDNGKISLSKAGKAIVYGGITLGAIQAIALAAAGFGDDEPPEFVRERAMIIPIGGKKYITIPMPLGFHVFPNLGRIPTEWALGGFKDAGKRVADMVGIFLEAFNPMGSAGMSLQTMMPTAIDPAIALAENKDWTGKPIYKEDFNSMKPSPGFERNKDTATAWSKGIAEALNYLSGGTDYTPGTLSPTADQIDFLIGQVTGGVGREVGKLAQAGESAVTGEELPTHKIPLLGRFYGNSDNQSSQGNAYYSNLQRIYEVEAEIKGRRQDSLPVEEYKADHPEWKLITRAKYADNIIHKLKKQKRELIERDAGREKIKAIEDRITNEMRRLNDAVKKLEEKEPA